MNWTTLLFFVGLLWICHVSSNNCNQRTKGNYNNLTTCLTSTTDYLFVADNFSGVIDARQYWNRSTRIGCIIFLQENATGRPMCSDEMQSPQMQTKNGSYVLQISKGKINNKIRLYVLKGKNCNTTVFNLTDSTCVFNHTVTGSCQVTCLDTETVCKNSPYDEQKCTNMGGKDEYFINIPAEKNCLNCIKPVRGPDVTYGTEKLKDLNITVIIEAGKPVNAAQAAKMMSNMGNLATAINVSSAELNLGEGVKGILKRETDRTSIDNVFFAYKSPNDSISIIDSTDTMATFSRSVTVPKEAFQKAFSSNVSVTFAALLRFTNLAKDAMNSIVLGNEVLAVEMGASITNLTDKININFQKLTYKGIPSCQSWDGQGSLPNWTGDGCLTIQNGENITCQCSHLTFFAILMSPPNDTISSSDLNTLTIITQVGCGLSMFFLGIVFYMHFFMRKIKASDATWILIHLMVALFLLDFFFLINNYAANLNDTVGCTIMAAFMHYFLLATFTWFATQAFHLWLQLYMGGNIVIRHYILKVSITAWVLPSVIGIILLIMGKYGEEVIYTNDTQEKVSMCWITDTNVHYIVNIAFYVVVFLFTFTTFIIILSWFFCLKRTRAGDTSNASRSGKNIVTILGLCCMLGITWGFAFFAYGALKIPSYYIFTTLNSFQGFLLFVYYYYNTRHSGERNSIKKHYENTSNTLTTSVECLENPYMGMPAKQ